MRNTGPARFLVPVGIILIVAGILFSVFNTKDYKQAEGIVSDVIPTTNDDGQKEYTVIFNFDTEDGRHMENQQFANLSKEYKIGDKIKVFIFDVRSLDKGLRIRISRTHSGFVKRLLENEVPEIADGVVEIKAIAREAGSRTKVAVVSHDENVDPVGACIGQRGARIDNIRFILGGDEKIDVIPYSEDIDAFIASALAPAEILKVEQDPNEEIVYHVTVPDNQLSLAIGNKGQNARLAAKLTGKKIDINPESGFYDPDKAAEALS